MFSEASARIDHFASGFWLHQRRSLDPDDSQTTSLPAIYAADKTEDDTRISISGLPDVADDDHRMSHRLFSAGSAHVAHDSVSEPPPDPFFLPSPSLVASHVSRDEPQQDILSISPAAMFLSSFSPMSAPKALPDDEGEFVSGYQLGPIIGHGAFSIIRRAFSEQGGTVAVKIVRHSDLTKQADPTLARKKLNHEAAVWASLSHEHILPLFTSSHTHYADFFVTLYCPAGSLYDILKRDGRPALPQDDAGMMFRQVVRGLRYMHEVAGVVHGDLKLENVLVDEMGVCKIGDFGMAKRIKLCDSDAEDLVDEDDEDESAPHELARAHRPVRSLTQSQRQRTKQATAHPAPLHLSLIRRHGGPRHRSSTPLPSSAASSSTPPNSSFELGSLPYASPELLLPSTSANPHASNPARDIWALGVMLYALLTGRLPFADSYEPRLQMKILHGVYEVPQGIGRGAEGVLQGCLERSVPSRWTIAMVDEVAWGIGWGSEGDDATPTPPELMPSPSRSRSRPATARESEVIDDVQSQSCPRVPRSKSRSASAVRTSSRSTSRPAAHHPYQTNGRHNAHHVHPVSPTFSSLTNAILRSNSSSSSSSSSSGPTDSAVLLTPSRSEGHESYIDALERGRPPRPHLPRLQQENVQSASRSRSPMTPSDFGLSPGGIRGRKESPRFLGGSPPFLPFTQRGGFDATGSELDTVAEGLPVPARWALSPDAGHGGVDGTSSRNTSCDERSSTRRRSPGSSGRVSWGPVKFLNQDGVRSGSMPPAPASTISWKHSTPRPSLSTRSPSVATPRPIDTPSRTLIVRSRSADAERYPRRRSWGL